MPAHTPGRSSAVLVVASCKARLCILDPQSQDAGVTNPGVCLDNGLHPSKLGSVCVGAGGMGTVPIHVPNGFLVVSPTILTPSTSYDGPSDTWTTYQTIAVGATGLADISLITSAVAPLPANAQVCSAVGATTLR